MKNPIRHIQEGTFVLPWGITAATAGVMLLLGALMMAGAASGHLASPAATCTVTEVTASQEGSTIRVGLDCNTGGTIVKAYINQAQLVLDVVRRDARSLTCDIYASGSARDCKING